MNYSYYYFFSFSLKRIAFVCFVILFSRILNDSPFDQFDFPSVSISKRSPTHLILHSATEYVLRHKETSTKMISFHLIRRRLNVGCWTYVCNTYFYLFLFVLLLQIKNRFWRKHTYCCVHYALLILCCCEFLLAFFFLSFLFT